MSLKLIEIKPMDVLMFRSNRPFKAGRQHTAHSIDVFLPQTFEGAIKSKILLNFLEAKRKSLEDINEIGKLEEGKRILQLIGFPQKNEVQPKIKVLSVLLSRNNKLYFPLPKDLVKVEDESKNDILVRLKPLMIEEIKSGDLYSMVHDNYEYFKEVEGFIEYNTLKKWLFGSVDELEIDGKTIIVKNKGNYPIKRETRIGIELIKESKTSEERKFYAVDFLRLDESWKFECIVEIENEYEEIVEEYLPKKGAIKLGGEARLCDYKVVDDDFHILTDNEKEEIKKGIEEKGMFALYLASPSYFGFWKPQVFNEHAKLIAASIGKPIVLGGFDLARGIQKPLRSYVMSGAVYYFKLQNSLENWYSNPFKLKDNNIELRLGLLGIVDV